MNKVELRMAIPAVTREYTPGSCRNSTNPMRHSPRREMRPKYSALGAEQFVFPIKHVRSLNVLDGKPESPQDHCRKTRGSLLSLQEWKIAQCTPSQL